VVESPGPASPGNIGEGGNGYGGFIRLRLVFCGTPQFAVPTLEALIAAGHEIALVVTQPDRPVGRKQQLVAPAVKQVALAAGLPVVQPEKIKNNVEFRERLEAIAPDAIVVVAYGRIIPLWMLNLPRLGCINLHGSLLPRHRGAAPIQWAVALGDPVTGNTTMLLEEGLDTGPILLQQSVAIGPEQTAVDLFAELAGRGAPLMVETLAGLALGTLKSRAQDASLATLARILEREDGRMDFSAHTAVELWNRWRGFQPWPGAFTQLDGKKLIVHRVRMVAGTQLGEPGILVVDADRIRVGCADGSWLELVELQVEGKKRMTAAEFLRGNALASGVRLG
jgi:methionyl-tRNA formyltransferase